MKYNLILKAGGKATHIGFKGIGGHGNEYLSTACGSGVTSYRTNQESLTGKEFKRESITCKKCLRAYDKMVATQKEENKMTKLEMVELIAKMVELGTEQAERIIVNAVSDWGLQKSENFYELLVQGDFEKASKRATVAELKEMEEFIAYYKGDEPVQEERTVFFSAQEAYNYEQDKKRKADNNEVKKQKVGIQEKVSQYNNEVVSYEDGDNYVPSHMTQIIAENAYQGFAKMLTDWVLDNSAKIAHYSGCAHLFPDSVKQVVQIVGGKYGVGEFSLSQLAQLKLKAEKDLNRLVGRVAGEFYDWKGAGL